MLSHSNLSLLLGLLVTGSLAGPCDIYASGNTPCVAAHATTRALYDSYSGSLYQVQRGSDGAKSDIKAVSAGGVANAAAQDSFCANTTCLITIIYDQSGRGNHLTQAPPGGAASGPQPNGYDDLASAIGAPVTLNGKKAYGVFVSPGTGYRNNRVNGVATGDAAEGMYAIMDGTHFNGGCVDSTNQSPPQLPKTSADILTCTSTAAALTTATQRRTTSTQATVTWRLSTLATAQSGVRVLVVGPGLWETLRTAYLLGLTLNTIRMILPSRIDS